MLCDLIKLEVMDIQLYLAVGKTSQVGSHLLQVAGAMAPLHEVAVHLISSQLHQLITLIAWFHRLQLIEKLKERKNHLDNGIRDKDDSVRSIASAYKVNVSTIQVIRKLFNL